jgi:hypothetical protein
MKTQGYAGGISKSIESSIRLSTRILLYSLTGYLAEDTKPGQVFTSFQKLDTIRHSLANLKRKNIAA